MSFYFREKPRFGDKLRGKKSRDELLRDLKQEFDENSKSFFEPAASRISRDPFDRHAGFSRGFPFDDVEGFGRRGKDIRSHLDDLASRHPEFADHLLGPPWGDIPSFQTGSLRNRRRGSGSSSSYQGHPDEDTRSQASGSSGASAASGASGVSSQGETSANHGYGEQEIAGGLLGDRDNSSGTRRNPIPQYGLRNTVDIGQHRHNMENPEKSNRGQRSMSAPPENRQQDEAASQDFIQQQQNSQNPNQRFVSRVDITPQFVPAQAGCEKTTATKQQPQQQQQQQPQPQQQQKPQQQQSNVRHIPIFVEGRDEPVIPKNVETNNEAPWTFTKPQPTVPPQFQAPPQFHRPSHFNQHYGGRARDWLPNFEEEFYTPQAPFQQPTTRRTQQHQQYPSQSPPRHFPGESQFRQQQNPHEHSHFPQQAHNQQHNQQHNQHHQQHNQQHNQHHQQQQQPQHQQQREVPQTADVPVRKQTQPQDPLERVADVQKEVDALTEQVKLWVGNSRKDKQYMYLDEMLTRELIKLDDIETEGKENVRQARKNAIKSIQNSISLLESKAPTPEQQAMELQDQTAVISDLASNAESANNDSEKLGENEQRTNEQQQQQEPIPLPPAPSSPTKEPSPAEPEATIAEEQQKPQEESSTQDNQNHVDAQENQITQETVSNTVQSTPVTKVPSVASMEIQGPEANVAPKEQQELQQSEDKPATVVPETNATDAAMEVENQAKSPKAAKKVKKAKKQQPQQQTPVSDGAIPLPAPEQHQTDTNK